MRGALVLCLLALAFLFGTVAAWDDRDQPYDEDADHYVGGAR